MAEKTTTVLSYHDSCLTADDVKLLEVGQWLNDKLIGFWFEYVEHTVLESCEDVVLVTPTVTQMMKFASVEQMQEILEPLRLPSRSVVMFAVNDNLDDNAAGGGHWSLLCYARVINSFLHYDSIKGAPNSQSAMSLEKTMAAVLQCKVEPRHIEVESPCQTNLSDCGMYVIFYAEHVATEYAKQVLFATNAKSLWDLQRTVRVPLPADIEKMRLDVRICIEDLAKTGDLKSS